MKLSASKLIQFSECNYSVYLDMKSTMDSSMKRNDKKEDVELIRQQGENFEKSILEHVSGHADVTYIPVVEGGVTGFTLQKTVEAMQLGAEYIYQAALQNEKGESGTCDFLKKTTDKPSKFGDYSYEVVDNKLKGHVDTKYVHQLVLYSDILAEMQDAKPDHAYLYLKDRQQTSGDFFRVETITLNDVEEYSRLLKSQFEAFYSTSLEDLEQNKELRPLPCSFCDMCQWNEHCNTKWKSKKSLTQIANVSISQIKKIESSGVKDIPEFVQYDGNIPKLDDRIHSTLKTQAELQLNRMNGGDPEFRLKDFKEDKGLNKLPEPQEGDMFYDIEGNPYHEENGTAGLEYLNGIWFVDSFLELGSLFNDVMHYESGKFLPIWAHSRADEKQALIRLFTFFSKQIEAFPKARIYHYAPYEITALRNLAQSHGYGEQMLDNWLREERFVDLYKIVSESMICSEPGYSIKNMEVFYLPPEMRAKEVKNGGQSIVAYENWRNGGPDSILDEIRDYNQVDCESTMMLRDWIVEKVCPQDFEYNQLSELKTISEISQEKDELAQERFDKINNAEHLSEEEKKFLYSVNMFFQREAKPAWWAFFDRRDKTSEQLVEDMESIGGMQAISDQYDIKRSVAREYSFPPQETKLRKDSSANVFVGDKASSVTIESMNLKAGTCVVKWGKANGDLPDTLDVVPGKPIDASKVEAALTRFIDAYVDQEDKFSCGKSLLERRNPEFKNGHFLKEVSEDELVDYTVATIENLDNSVLPIQGPPGTGKTYVLVRAISNLVKQGYKVGVTSNSHKAIDNVLIGLAQFEEDNGREISIFKKATSPLDHAMIGYGAKFDIESVQVFGSTYWEFCSDYLEEKFDYLIVDEAGQCGLPHILACSTAAKNLVLVGDPQQLPQPILGTHPDGASKSCLEHILNGAETIPSDKGIFQPISRRMHQSVCSYVSDIAYENRLYSDEQANGQSLVLDGVAHTGVQIIKVEHYGNSQTSDEEIEAMIEYGNSLIGSEFTDRDGNSQEITWDDILIVAPYNAQVNLIRDRMPYAKAGTVDKFQGQEAPICFLSMTSSSQEEMPRDVNFLFNQNRLNVAVSRAKVMSSIFCSPKLLQVKCNKISDIKLVNNFLKIK